MYSLILRQFTTQISHFAAPIMIVLGGISFPVSGMKSLIGCAFGAFFFALANLLERGSEKQKGTLCIESRFLLLLATSCLFLPLFPQNIYKIPAILCLSIAYVSLLLAYLRETFTKISKKHFLYRVILSCASIAVGILFISGAVVTKSPPIEGHFGISPLFLIVSVLLCFFGYALWKYFQKSSIRDTLPAPSLSYVSSLFLVIFLWFFISSTALFLGIFFFLLFSICYYMIHKNSQPSGMNVLTKTQRYKFIGYFLAFACILIFIFHNVLYLLSLSMRESAENELKSTTKIIKITTGSGENSEIPNDRSPFTFTDAFGVQKNITLEEGNIKDNQIDASADKQIAYLVAKNGESLSKISGRYTNINELIGQLQFPRAGKYILTLVRGFQHLQSYSLEVDGVKGDGELFPEHILAIPAGIHMDCQIDKTEQLKCKYPTYQGKTLDIQIDSPAFQYAQLAEKSLEFSPLQVKNNRIITQLPSTLSGGEIGYVFLPVEGNKVYLARIAW